jgi:hypothetical protein
MKQCLFFVFIFLSCGRAELESSAVLAADQSPVSNQTVLNESQGPVCNNALSINNCALEGGYQVYRWQSERSAGGEVLALGVYETNSQHSGSNHPEGTAQVSDTRAAPHTLLLSSYEPVAWTINKAPGSGLTKVIFAGHHPQRVVSGQGFEVENTSGSGTSFACAYSIPYNGGGCNPADMFSWLERTHRSTVSGFAGCYRASSFTVSDCTAPTSAWEPLAFQADATTSGCSGEKFVKYNRAMNIWIGAQLCSRDEYKLYLAPAREGPFEPIGDGSGHGQDHCEVLVPGFRLPIDDDVTSGGCSTCSVKPWSLWSTPGGFVWQRSAAGQTFVRREWGPGAGSIHTSSKYRCGVSIP